MGTSLYRFYENGLGGGMRAHEVQKGCWQVGGTNGNGVYTTKLMRLTQVIKRCVSAALVECPYYKMDEVNTVFLKSCVPAIVRELQRGGFTTNEATLYSFSPIKYF